jgi:hypothetical protein
MARREVIEIVCDRCSRTELVNPESYNTSMDLELYFGKPAEGSSNTREVMVIFHDLCSSCNKSVRNYIGQIRMDAKKKDDTQEVPPFPSEGEPAATRSA